MSSSASRIRESRPPFVEYSNNGLNRPGACLGPLWRKGHFIQRCQRESRLKMDHEFKPSYFELEDEYIGFLALIWNYVRT